MDEPFLIPRILRWHTTKSDKIIEGDYSSIKEKLPRDNDDDRDLCGNSIRVRIGDDASPNSLKVILDTSVDGNLHKRVSILKEAVLYIAAYIEEKRLKKKEKDEQQHERGSEKEEEAKKEAAEDEEEEEGEKEAAGENEAEKEAIPDVEKGEEKDVFSRKNEKKKLIDRLTSKEASEKNLHVVPIVGMEGMGKTTLTKASYNDEKALFRRHSLENRDPSEEHPELEEVGKQITDKCKGLPLALKAIAGWKSAKDLICWNKVDICRMQWGKIKKLPDSICALYNLETLLLSSYRYIEELPLHMEKLINLRHLDISNPFHLNMLLHLSKLKNLKVLVGAKFLLGGLRMEDLVELHKLYPKLKLEAPIQLSSLKWFEVVDSPKVAFYEAELFISQLEGMKKIEELSISGCCSLSFLPTSSLPNTLKIITICCCWKLKLEALDSSKMISNTFLKQLKLEECDYMSSVELVPRARYLYVWRCQNLTRFLIPNGTETPDIMFCENVEILSVAYGT
ncbi:hypothetical protein FXO38_19935 [Capsicum annuum]|nr:hypothetical protein FXO38_19935 [Capsicum annuum]